MGGKIEKVFFPKNFETKFTKYGKEKEKEALEAFKKDRNVQVVTPGLFISGHFPWLTDSPDGIICNNTVPMKLFEIQILLTVYLFRLLFLYNNLKSKFFLHI